ncbi:MAG TPA: catalase, partial [Acidimicrobiales bacterium]|nr:catalase [Acidimicrobiales bacterium]
LHRVGRLVLTQNPDNYFTETELAAFEPANMVPGIGPSPDRMLLGRMFSYADAHRYRIGTNYLHLPINQPRAAAASYNSDGAMAMWGAPDPVYAPNSFGGPQASAAVGDPSWGVAGEIVRSAYTRRRDDDDFAQARDLYEKVLDTDSRQRLVSNIVGHLRDGVHGEVLARTLDYWRQVSSDLGDRVRAGIAPRP